MKILAEAGVPCSAVLDTRDLMHDPHLRAREFIKPISHPTWGDVEVPGFPSRLSDSEVAVEAAPKLGEGTDEILKRDLGIDGEELAALRLAGVVAGGNA